MKKNIWLRLLVISMGVNGIGAVMRISGAGDVSTYVLWIGMIVFIIAIGVLITKVFTR